MCVLCTKEPIRARATLNWNTAERHPTRSVLLSLSLMLSVLTNRSPKLLVVLDPSLLLYDSNIFVFITFNKAESEEREEYKKIT